MATMSFAMRDVSTPQAAVAKFFVDQATLLPEHISVSEVPAGDWGDRAWVWDLLEGAPTVRCMSGTPIVRDRQNGGVRLGDYEDRYPIRHGVVLELESYGVMFVAADDGDADTDEQLLEYAASMLGV